ncbi:DUF2339 domain-containing protein [Natronobacterium gregoryi]|uniref:Uncharacterized protein n=2 Tax=Natronobacterium gregoryi TaxID=44930 RepID=L0AKP7_NATGS|nr:hypothetical protein [Natronobacterium gregoryi]AFZ74381.1 hypothetical protein Natgr_3252 [Natronobacterium gregoryi SP2]ELY74104.1 hypothetical protein C490_00695 [Natronobacterium gregoryi SP2]PLK22108.1 hypothetical protein CYV19_00055 [Natronobacterium gregoryi SP2]SFJ61326.1 hypothetical protein SAMN05443661_1467 [Natronobacterium gregoryi]
MSANSASVDEPFRKVALAIGFFVLAGSVLLARSRPATGYELSLYTSTPLLFWVGLLLAVGIGIAVAFVSPTGSGRTRPVALVLGGLSMLVFAGLPIVRGYRFYGHHDALTHLGWARAITEGTMLPFELYYPGIHTVTTLVHSTLGTSVAQSLLYVVVLSILVFCVFVPLAVGTIVEDGRAMVVAAFAGFLLLPITTISMYMSAHAMSQAVMFSALLCYLLARYLRTDGAASPSSALGIALGLTAVATVVYHPQLVAHLIVVFLGIAVVQYLAKRVASDGQIAGQTPVYGHTVLLIALFLVWTSNHGFFGGMFEYFLTSAVEFVLEGRGGADTVATQGASLSAIGGSLGEIFFKLFFAQLVFVLLTVALAFGVVGSRSALIRRVRPETTYFTVALVALGPPFVIYFVAPGSTMHFRVFGLMMVFVTILGSIAAFSLFAWLTDSDEPRSRARLPGSRPLFAVGFACLLVLSLAAVFPSPYTYHASPHVSDTQMEGYETAFDGQLEDVQFVGLRNGPNRYDDAVNGNAERMGLHEGPPDEGIGAGLADQYDEDRYFVLTQADYERETIAYQELRHTGSELESVTDQPDVDRIQSNGEFELYYVNAEPEFAEA